MLIFKVEECKIRNWIFLSQHFLPKFRFHPQDNNLKKKKLIIIIAVFNAVIISDWGYSQL